MKPSTTTNTVNSLKALLASVLLLASCVNSYAQAPAEKQILDILTWQTEEWNRGNIENFMSGYWNDDSLMFV